ncbi:oxidoreductase [Paeniglutamicibacter antarcticus]|uniref:Oxidoreductase n=1 Tax=Arthrobacter terrae TaxID=2935737 RepID=A0A931CKM6_9MICC|nr:oxidoreductase [Arthrobacter terrae]MBG0740317.1 oxidoreductase [Arthrobacter terrae]
MKVLILGGTAWLGHEVGRRAIKRGHAVTCVARGKSGRVPAGAAFIRADRDEENGLGAVAGISWGAVVDVSRQPGQVRRAVRDLNAVRYVFVSSGSAYADQGPLGQDEDAPLLAPLAADVMETMEDYGQAKAACEQAVLAQFGPRRSMIVRAGLIGGPGDTSGRTGYWPLRFGRPASDDGTVLVPDAPLLPVQIIDVRDLAVWLVHGCEEGLGGVFNAMGETHPFGEHIAVARKVAGHEGPIATAGASWLQRRGVQEWAGPKSLPLWLADSQWQGMNARSNLRAKAAGLKLRPLAETLADTLDWERRAGAGRIRSAGLTMREEAALLAELAALRA